MSESKKHHDDHHKKIHPHDQPVAADESGAAGAVNEGPFAELQKERDDARDQLLRTRAEFVNYQKRSKQQADVDRTYAIGNLAHDLLDVIDNFQRATDSMRGTAGEGIAAGLDIVHKQFLATLAKYGVEPIEALGQPFDPNFHDALLQQPSADHPEGTVVAELSKGYKIHDRVLRPSKVAVSAKP
ncbi:nucleotide exchange factor GrpE [Paludisphaera borealis]|uniref:Protein GrpE n=1 Tax=Paludisphaera borealis TaxID=1387353 RepID=A0A1U7CYD0_9BACT|nr:nucleotide exchange factor GrpE [Paludisphaera borealis]APW63960.1 Protein GrpE [Paludisphaera borealis]